MNSHEDWQTLKRRNLPYVVVTRYLLQNVTFGGMDKYRFKWIKMVDLCGGGGGGEDLSSKRSEIKAFVFDVK